MLEMLRPIYPLAKLPDSVPRVISRWTVAVLPLTFLIASYGCKSPEEVGTVTILEPVEGSTICGTLVHVSTEYTNLELTGSVARVSPEHGEGPGDHIDFTLDGEVVLMGIPEGFDIESVLDGAHELVATVVYDDHDPVEPAINDTVNFTVDNAVCATP